MGEKDLREAERCIHVFEDGTRCKQPARKGLEYCRHHDPIPRPPEKPTIPDLEDDLERLDNLLSEFDGVSLDDLDKTEVEKLTKLERARTYCFSEHRKAEAAREKTEAWVKESWAYWQHQIMEILKRHLDPKTWQLLDQDFQDLHERVCGEGCP